MNGVQSRIREATDLPRVDNREFDAKIAALRKTVWIHKVMLAQSKRFSRRLWEQNESLCAKNKILAWENQETQSLRLVVEEQRDMIYGPRDGQQV